jgi:hypothetical protein
MPIDDQHIKNYRLITQRMVGDQAVIFDIKHEDIKFRV